MNLYKFLYIILIELLYVVMQKQFYNKLTSTHLPIRVLSISDL
jgi:hypothetical protein